MNAVIRLLSGDLDAELAELLAGVGTIACDIETSGLDPVAGRIGTVQLHAPSVGSVIVQTNGTRPARLIELMRSPDLRKVFHHAMFDLRFMAAQWDVRAANIGCTKIASKLLRRDAEQGHTLQALLREYLDVEIDKTQRMTDWLLSSLTEAQLQYASRDVMFLVPLHEKLILELDRVGLTEIYHQCTEFVPTRVVLDLGAWPDVFTY